MPMRRNWCKFTPDLGFDQVSHINNNNNNDNKHFYSAFSKCYVSTTGQMHS